MIRRKYEVQTAVKFTKGMSREAPETQLLSFQAVSNFDNVKDQDKLTRFTSICDSSIQKSYVDGRIHNTTPTD